MDIFGQIYTEFRTKSIETKMTNYNALYDKIKAREFSRAIYELKTLMNDIKNGNPHPPDQIELLKEEIKAEYLQIYEDATIIAQCT